MQLADWIRASIWRLPHWGDGLAALCARTAADTRTTPARVADLAAACELIEPNPRRAIDMWQLAWRLGGDRTALERAYAIAARLGDLEVVATLATSAFEKSGGIADALAAARAFVDRGMHEEAEPLLVALLGMAVLPEDGAEVGSLLAVIRKQIRDPQAEAATWVARAAKASGAAAASKLLHAARIARLAKLDAIADRYIDSAWKAGRAPAAAVLIEQQLFAQRRADELVAFYRARVEATRGDREWFDEMRDAAIKLILAGVQRGLAHRMLRSALEAAYRARLVDIGGHLACWELLVKQAREARTGRELMSLVVEAMGQSLGDDERLYLARVGFEMSWREARDLDTARAYAAIIAELSTEDPALLELATASGAPAAAPTVRIHAPAAAAAPASGAAPAPIPAPTATPASDPASAAPSARRVGVPTSPPLPVNAVARAPRVVVPIDVQVQLGAVTFDSVVRDVSSSGLFLLTARDLPMSAFAKLTLELPTREMLATVRHAVTAKVVRRTDTGYGMLLIDPSPELVAAITALLAP